MRLCGKYGLEVLLVGVVDSAPPTVKRSLTFLVPVDDPATGIFGMDFYVVLGRRGNRVSRRKHATSRVGAPHKLTKEESKNWFMNKFEGIVT